MARLKRSRKNWPLRLFFVFLVLLVGVGVAARIKLTLVAPHVAFAPAAKLSDDKKKDLSDALDDQIPSDRDQAIEFALDYTAKSLSFSLDHAPSFDFSAKTRRASGTEYASLFVAVFDAAAKRAGSTAVAYRVRSAVRIFDKPVRLPAFAEHDWVMVADPADGARIFIDPTLADLWLGGTLVRNVKGGETITLPR